MTKENKVFQAEVKQILDLMVHSLYSRREIFLRELISNASDALDRLRFEEASGNLSEEAVGDAEKHIRLSPDKEKRQLVISDNGIGMSRDDLVNNIGTIAKSGTKEFLQRARELKDSPELIGQFGVGFYSAFMVADKVTVHTSYAGENGGTIWESTGDGNYTLEEAARPEGHGTTITLHLKDLSEEEDPQDFADQFTLQSVVRRYSDFIEFPIRMNMTREEPELDKDGKPVEGKTTTTTVDETLNSRKALWLKSPGDIKDDEYNEFYRHLTHDWTEPLEKVHYKAEGTQEFASLIYMPSQQPFDYNQRGAKWGLSLYVKRVFIMNDCEELVPAWLRFLKGVVDSSDLPLNVSRELLQKDRQIVGIRKAVVAKMLKTFKTSLEKDREKYEKFWGVFGDTLKEGLGDLEHKEKLQDLVLYRSTKGEGLTTLKEYVSRMPKDQKDIYFITGESLKTLQTSPYLEKIRKKGFEVLFMTDPVDDWVMQQVTKYDDKLMVSITKEGLDLESGDDKKKKEEELKGKAEKYKDLTDEIQEHLKENIKEVKISDRLVDSPCCLVSGAYDPSARMERLMESMGQEMNKSKRILEINPDHPVIEKMRSVEGATRKEWAEILYSQALLSEGSPLEDPMKFSKQITRLMEMS